MTRWLVYRKAVGIGAVVLTMLLSSTAARANMIVNGGFETGEFDDWLPIPPPVDSLFFVSGSPHTGHPGSNRPARRSAGCRGGTATAP